MVNFGPLAAEIGSVVWGTEANFNGFRILWANSTSRSGVFIVTWLKCHLLMCYKVICSKIATHVCNVSFLVLSDCSSTTGHCYKQFKSWSNVTAHTYFCSHICDIWNALPGTVVVDASSVNAFKRLLDVADYGCPAWQMLTLYFCPVVSFFLLLSFFPCLISAAADWMSTILPHMVLP